MSRWPWLDDGTPEPGPSETIEIGRNQYYGGAERRWLDWSDMPDHGLGLALWPLEAILGATTARRSGSLEVRGDACARYLCDVRPGDVARTDETKLVDPPGPDDDWRAVSAEVCIDASGFVRRVALSPTIGKRFTPGLLQRIAALLDSSPAPDTGFAGDGRLGRSPSSGITAAQLRSARRPM